MTKNKTHILCVCKRVIYVPLQFNYKTYILDYKAYVLAYVFDVYTRIAKPSLYRGLRSDKVRFLSEKYINIKSDFC